MKKAILLCIFQFIIILSFSQVVKPTAEDWYQLDFKKDGYKGISLTQAYELLKGRKNQQVVVAVIDSGIDTLQDDIKDNFWHNPNEIPGNNIDDDKNGLVDDVIGWNFLGGPDNQNLSISVDEAYRTYHRFKNEFDGKKEKDISKERRFVFSQWEKAEKFINDNYNDAVKEIDALRGNFKIAGATNSYLVKYFNKAVFTRKDLTSSPKTDSTAISMNVWNNIFSGKDFTNVDFMKDFEKYLKHQEEAIEQKTILPTNFRGQVLNDNGYDITKTHYGNNNMQTHSGYHGTSVSGIIGAVRNNGKGIDGIADNVKIMMIRAILGDHEFDKDVALAIRYAVDNGAKVINMSFGKPISPDKKWVDDAIKYAQEKDVVLVHAAGNDGKNMDIDNFYPNAFYLDGSRATNFINVGASGDYSNGGLVASFSNYGKKRVDVFAPGVDIHCSIANNGTQIASGTSMSSPVVAGIAALLRSYFPKLTAPQIVDILKNSGTEIDEEVTLPGTQNKKISFKKLSETGKIVNAYEAVKLTLAKYGN